MTQEENLLKKVLQPTVFLFLWAALGAGCVAADAGEGVVQQSEIEPGRFTYNSEVIVDHGVPAVELPPGLMWERGQYGAPVPRSWYDAVAYCRNLNLGGYSDWFLPSVEQLRVLAYYYGLLDTEIFRWGFRPTTSVYVWSVSQWLPEHPSIAWYVGFNIPPELGSITWDTARKDRVTFSARCAHLPPPPGSGP